VRFEFGELIGYAWRDLLANRVGESAVRAIQTGVADCQRLRPIELGIDSAGDSNDVSDSLPAGPGNDGFLIGHESGVLSANRWNVFEQKGETTTELERLGVKDTMHQQAITAIATCGTASATTVASGGVDGSVGILSAWDTAPIPVPLRDGLIRCLAVSADGRWVVAGVNQAVWVLGVERPEIDRARIPIGATSADSLIIDDRHDILMIGCGDGAVLSMNWTRCRLQTLLPLDEPASPDGQPTPAPGNRLTQRAAIRNGM